MKDQKELSDEEISYNDWVSENLIFINQNKNSVAIMKRLYIDGYAAGWQAKKEYQAKEWMEK